MTTKINTSRFYYEYKGHQIADINTFYQLTTVARPSTPIIYLAGDSSLDNKYWLPSTASTSLPTPSAPEIYHLCLTKPYPKADIAFWLNHHLGARATALNLAVEASLLRERRTTLLPHDEFIRDRITPADVLVVSVGGNDIAMSPTPLTVLHMLWLAWLTPLSSIRSGRAWALRYFVRMFKTQVQEYVEKMVAGGNKPRAVVVCMIYYPLEAQEGVAASWADAALRALGYNRWPERLQAVIRQIYERATREVRIEGVEVRSCALFEVLDGKNVADYEERVEPSVEGGRKMAELIAATIEDILEPETS